MKINSKNNVTKILPPIFIMGCKRSGTTLVSQILDTHSRIAIYHETHYYPIFYKDFHYYGNLHRQSNLVRFINDFREFIHIMGVNPPNTDEFLRALVAPTFEGVFVTLLHLYAKKQGKVRSGDKTPEHYAYLPNILEKFPDSPVIFVIRDPRDTVLSIRKAFDTSIEGATRLWNDAFLMYQQVSRQVHMVRYEDLVQRPPEIIEEMCSFLGENYEPAMLQFFKRIPEHLRTLSKVGKLVKPVNSGSIGKFRQMSSREIEQIEAACALGMQMMDYQFAIFKPKGTENMEIKVSKKNFLRFPLDRLRYYLGSRERLQHGWIHWKRIIRVRIRYLIAMGPLQKNW